MFGFAAGDAEKTKQLSHLKPEKFGGKRWQRESSNVRSCKQPPAPGALCRDEATTFGDPTHLTGAPVYSDLLLGSAHHSHF